MTKLFINHCFNPVGQGLFASGSISLYRGGNGSHQVVRGGAAPIPNLHFRWVYDCGTSRGKQSLKSSIKRLAHQWRGDKIDLLTLSHFHSDHISGVVQLLKAIEAKTVMLPWAPLWRRLAIGFAQGLRTDDLLMGFFVDPAAYLLSVVPDRFQSVLFVMPSEGPGPAFQAEPPIEPESALDGGDLDIEQNWGEPGDPNDLELTGYGRPTTVKLAKGRRISIGGLWEFIPYNDPTTSPHNLAKFQAIVDVYREILLNGGETSRKQALRDLRRFFDASFPGHSAMNDVSLMLYAGAVGKWQGHSYCDCISIRDLNGGIFHFAREQDTKGTILLTGDADFSSAAKWASLERYLTASRVKRASVFQVAHHGARANWHQGLAARATPATSVFSSDPRHKYGHPHAEVLRDFWSFQPVQVDQQTGFSKCIVLHR